jgi:histidinol-phosphate aminotransferase
LRTLSKAWGLAGVRCGAVIAADPLVINTLRYIQVPFGFPTPSQEIVAERCLSPQEMINSWGQVRKERDRLSKELSTLNIVEKIISSHTNFLLIEFNNFSQAMNVLRQHKIHVVDCSSTIPNSIRVSVGNMEENQKFLDVLQSF